MLNSCLYKFLWNKHFQAAKAPERIKREIINTPIQLGGFGMLDIADLDNGLKLRALGRSISTNHPYLKLVGRKINWENFFEPKCDVKTDPYISKAVGLLAGDRRAMLGFARLEGDSKYVSLLGNTKISSIISRLGRNSLNNFILTRRGVQRLRDLTATELESIAHHLPRDYLREARKYVGPQMRPIPSEEDRYLYLTRTGLKPIGKLSSKDLRTARHSGDPICLFKIGMILTPSETITWGSRLKKLTSTKHKSTLLRAAHGEVYTREKLFKFKLIDSPLCLNCNMIETLSHKIYECPYPERIWRETFKLTDRLKVDSRENADVTQKILGATLNSNKILLTIHAEVLTRILTMRSTSSYLILPKMLLKSTMKYLINKEQDASVKECLRALLSE